MAQIRDRELLERIAEKIKTLREAAGISQQAFYDETNIHVGRIEQAKTNVSVSTVKAVCAHIELTLADFSVRSRSSAKPTTLP